MAVSARAGTAAARRLPSLEAPARPDDRVTPRPRLDVVDRRSSQPRSLKRQANVLRAFGVAFVVGALGITAAAHTFVASDQQRVDALQAALTQTVAQQQDLQISRAELEAPVRVLNIAEHQLGMVAPASVTYLPPVNPGPSVQQAGASAAASGAAGHVTRSAKSRPGAKTSGTGSPSSATNRPG